MTGDEQAQARAFADAVDRLTAGSAAVASDELVATAAAIRAAFAEAATADHVRTSSAVDAAVAAAHCGAGRSRWLRWMRRRPRFASAATGLAAACAALALVVYLGGDSAPRVAEMSPSTRDPLPTADDIVGVIPPGQSGAAAERLDRIYAQRMSQYRARYYGRQRRGGP